MKVLVIAHAHPDFSVGGAENAAYNLFRAMRDRDDVASATFLARTDSSSVGWGAIKLYRDGEYQWKQAIGDWFRLRTVNIESVLENFDAFLRNIAPDVIFVQHYVHIGVEFLRQIKQSLPDSKLVLTLHEFMAICHSQGQFVKSQTRKLCYRESPEACTLCFPEFTASDFWLRKHFIQKHFEFVDIFVSPSDFLRQRYIDWGIPPEKITVIENGQPTLELVERAVPEISSRVRFGFFGQVNPYKGVDILLKAASLLPEEVQERISIEIHGANLEGQTQAFQETIAELREPLEENGCLRWVGPYEAHELSRRMSKVDWVVVPSIWWENSPMVIQEAFVNRKPVICADIGGMAEKVRDGVDGLHFEVRNPLSLADTLTLAATKPSLRAKLSEELPLPPSYAECASLHLRLFEPSGADSAEVVTV